MKTVVLLCLFAAPAFAQEQVSMHDPRWHIEAAGSRVERHLGRESLWLRDGSALLEGVKIKDGVIEFDVAAPATVGFPGVVFRAHDGANYELAYLRYHLSGQPDATQYTPVFNNLFGWQIYTSRRYSLPAIIAPDRWVHVRLAVRDKRAELTVDDSTLVFPELVRAPAEGLLGLIAGAGPSWFTNFSYSAETPVLSGRPGAPPDSVVHGVIKTWRVSSAFKEGAPPNALTWDTLSVGSNGIANLAMRSGVDSLHNTVVAATAIESDARKQVRLRFGYSDRVQVILNGQTIYRGNATFQSRDQRFLGTVGLFDELVLPLRRGRNELWFVVSETFGGWAITAAMD